MVRIFVFACALALVINAGCASTRHTDGMRIYDDDVRQIVKGQTTMQEVIELFGEPDKVTQMGPETLYTYQHSVSRSKTMYFPYVASGEGSTESDKLSIVFDKNNIVKTYSLKRGIGKT